MSIHVTPDQLYTMRAKTASVSSQHGTERVFHDKGAAPEAVSWPLDARLNTDLYSKRSGRAFLKTAYTPLPLLPASRRGFPHCCVYVFLNSLHVRRIRFLVLLGLSKMRVYVIDILNAHVWIIGVCNVDVLRYGNKVSRLHDHHLNFENFGVLVPHPPAVLFSRIKRDRGLVRRIDARIPKRYFLATSCFCARALLSFLSRLATNIRNVSQHSYISVALRAFRIATHRLRTRRGGYLSEDVRSGRAMDGLSHWTLGRATI